ncbi:MAG: class I SAM-dependent methyltransferase [Mariprofundaceae bacterium]
MVEADMEARLNQFLTGLPVQSIASMAAASTQRDVAEITQILETFRNEARATLAVIAPHMRPQSRLLEVGAGLCLFSLFLKREGYEITALEPALGGYSLFDTLRRLILDLYNDVALPVLTCPAGELDSHAHGSFDLIFSNNVIEHIPNWEGALTAMLGVLAADGCMLHACPNYSVPYEPHYGVPVLRRLPELSRRFFLPATANAEIWDSLNFICHRQVRHFASIHGYAVSFESGLIYQALSRMQSDPLFRERHKGFIASVADILARSGLLKLLLYLPPNMSTPMVFVMRRKVC